ncbi:outer membrane protein OmpA-like peptidoglycan-associated protein [Streptosporangium album]|uniref:Outer membrane protein OmpA-like peptidoglycan-associated protein n=1 Tax=Streptosporangium album TaxID=47479 RepID=A0A7W7RXB0_9ACTN|nr:OmpA family protein [Streptosporangium album]MBB4939949.1 outer membrane protein OmpA-like peptidoglycan-associated protein [Streptosporangium album]
MSRSPEPVRHVLGAAALAVALVAGVAPAAWAEPDPPAEATAPVDDLILPVDDILAEIESLDGSESESKQGQTVTLALTSDVLFALDRAALTARATARLGKVAGKIKQESAGGLIKIMGHTDDQGADAYNDRLSLRRAQAVQEGLRELLAGQGVTFQAAGFGERRPKVPNVVDGRPSEENRARNRRVEIVFTAR